MKAFTVMVVVAACMLSGCGQAAGGAARTEALVKEWVSAYEAKEADRFLALYADDLYYADHAIGAFIEGKDGWSSGVRSTFPEEAFAVKVTSYFVSPDGRHAAVEGVYSDSDRQGRVVSVPMAAILEFKEGKIVRETDYYDAGSFR
jgi:steroid delta-isomerase-like uncharacterized protein